MNHEQAGMNQNIAGFEERNTGSAGTASRVVLLALLACLAACQPAGEGAKTDVKSTPDMTDPVAQASYAVAYDLASRYQARFSGALDAQAFQRGVADGFAGADKQVSDEAAQTAFPALQAAQQAALQKLGEAAAATGEAFLKKNAEREGVVVLDSGLQYEVLHMGEGAKPTPADKVTTHYHGTLVDGKVFDSSVARGQPATFGVSQVIAGWTEALQLMPEGSKWRLFIPANLAYGARGAGDDIPPHSALIFDVELLSIERASSDADAG